MVKYVRIDEDEIGRIFLDGIEEGKMLAKIKMKCEECDMMYCPGDNAEPECTMSEYDYCKEHVEGCEGPYEQTQQRRMIFIGEMK